MPSDGSERQDCPQSSPWPLPLTMIPLLTLSAGLGDPEPEGADISVAGLSPRRSQRWSVSVTGHSLRLEWLLVTAGHWWSLVSSNWSHSSVLQSGSAHSELVTVSSLLSLGPGRLGTGRGARHSSPPLPALHWRGPHLPSRP